MTPYQPNLRALACDLKATIKATPEHEVWVLQRAIEVAIQALQAAPEGTLERCHAFARK